jgi:tetratricopeptide (TPR) repeat protein
MSFLDDWREYLPSQERLYAVVGLVVIVAIGVGDFLFVRSSIIPQLRARQALISQLASAEKELREAQQTQGDTPERLREQVATAEATLDEVANRFLSESQAAGVLNRLYEHASESGVAIVNLQTQPGSGEKQDVYDPRRFRLQVEGTLPKLIEFVSRIKEAALESFKITDVNITEGEVLHTLTLDITLYTSPYASATGVQDMPAVPPLATTTVLPQLEQALVAAWASEEWAQAIDLINRIRAIDPSYDDMADKLYTAHINYGYQLLEQEDVDGATAQFHAALEIKPGGEEVAAGLQEASATPSPTLTVEEQLAQRLHEPWAAEDWEEVISLIEQIREITPDYDDMTEKLYAAHVNYGHSLATEGKLEEAKEEFSRALATKPDGEEAIGGLRELAGESLPLSPTPTPTPQSWHTTYVVRRGDTLYSIARRHGTTVEAIMQANGLTSYTIYVGQRLYMP